MCLGGTLPTQLDELKTHIIHSPVRMRGAYGCKHISNPEGVDHPDRGGFNRLRLVISNSIIFYTKNNYLPMVRAFGSFPF